MIIASSYYLIKGSKTKYNNINYHSTLHEDSILLGEMKTIFFEHMENIYIKSELLSYLINSWSW